MKAEHLNVLIRKKYLYKYIHKINVLMREFASTRWHVRNFKSLIENIQNLNEKAMLAYVQRQPTGTMCSVREFAYFSK